MSMDHSFSTYTKFFEKLTFLTPTGKRACALSGGERCCFLENFDPPHSRTHKKNISLHIYLPLQRIPWVQLVTWYILNNLPT